MKRGTTISKSEKDSFDTIIMHELVGSGMVEQTDKGSATFSDNEYAVIGRPIWLVMRAIDSRVPMEADFKSHISFMCQRLEQLVVGGHVPLRVQWQFADKIMGFVRDNDPAPWLSFVEKVYAGEVDYRELL